MKDLDERASHQLHNHLLVMFGDDFTYKVAGCNFENMDRMIQYMNLHYPEKYTFKYSTPSEYIDEVFKL